MKTATLQNLSDDAQNYTVELLRPKSKHELLLLLTSLFPPIVCLQETFLKPNDKIKIKNYAQYKHIHNIGQMATWGISILIRNDILLNKILT